MESQLYPRFCTDCRFDINLPPYIPAQYAEATPDGAGDIALALRSTEHRSLPVKVETTRSGSSGGILHPNRKL